MTERTKDILKTLLYGLLCGICCSLMIIWGYHIAKNKYNKPVETVTVTDTIRLTDTITHWQPYDVHHYRTDTAYLPVIDTLLDTVTDTVLVEIPIEIYHYDTIIKDINYTTHLNAILSGFHTSIDTLTVHTEIMPQQPQKKIRVVPAIGVGYGTGGWGVFGGVGISYW